MKVVSDEELAGTWAAETSAHLYGKMAKHKQNLGDPRELERVAAESQSEKEQRATVACEKGSKGAGDPSPNQDNYSLTFFNNGYAMACAFDGHGQDGHRVATRTVQTVPYFLARSSHFPDDMEDALEESFLNAQSELISYALENRR